MPWAQMQWRSDVLQKQTTMQVLLPNFGRPPWPVFYLLHGLSDDSTVWMRHTRIEWYVREWPMMVVMPDGYRGFYTDNDEGPAYARHIGRELVEFVDRSFRTVASREGRAIGGLSMGGYGALRVGLGYPDRFCSINSHSGALGRLNADFTRDLAATERHKEKSRAFLEELRRVFGEHPHGTGHDLLVLARKAREQDRLPALMVDCGREDFLLAESREFHRALKAEGITHDYHEHAGAHDWDYWDRHVQDAIKFHARNLGVERVAMPRMG